ncbi:hypothetical protein LPJ73_000854 [Coemansia sp. RSA 2703]|nr:hypothetical protein LPJ73_000854 [Coemansia sp. RSA 2703]KAJ2374164.1 hypothetical protein IW150_003254 [Coemansia sp. RSA 2607]KAJ2395156.1 hypothetical protein GGI05_001718 [Coemansia sp. RSA 2603]
MALRSLARRTGTWIRRYAHRFLFHNDEYLREELLVTSYFVPQPTLGLIRTGIFAYCLTVLVANLAVNIVHDAGWNWAAYFTTLTFFGITLYYGFAAYNTLRYTVRRRKQQLWWRQSAQQVAEVASESKRTAEEMSVAHTEKLLGSDRSEMPRRRDARTPVVERVHQRSTVAAEEIEEIVEEQRQASEHSDSESMQKDAVVGEEAQTETTNASSATVVAGQAACQRLSTRHQLSLATQWLLYESFTCYAPLVTLIYWCLLYPTQGGFVDALDTWMGVSMHACNAVLMVLEIGVFARTRYRWTHGSVMICVLVAYLALVYFMVGVYGFYVYPFFETRYFGAYVAVVCLLVVDVVGIVWVVMLLVHRARDAVYLKWLSRRRSPAFAF